MNNVFKDMNLVIFDLDGTLYEDTDHFDYYAELLKEKVTGADREDFAKDYEKMKKGIHPVTIGKAYDVNRDSILTLDPISLDVVEVLNWDGSPWSEDKFESTYSDGLTFDFETMIAVGDGWWLPFVTAKHYGVTGEETYNCYTRTKDFMVTEAFQLTKTPGLKEGLKSLKEQTQIVLVTNSEADDVGRLLKELELDSLFEEIIPLAQKPVQTKRIFVELMEKYNVKPEKTLAIGDNFINEIAPALSLGMKTLYIQSFGAYVRHKNLEVINSMANIFNDK
jgi:FMN phosphatase YigB (HAD superfamily)